MPAGGLAKGAGTHLASWLQEVSTLSSEDAQSILDGFGPEGAPRGPSLAAALEGMRSVHGSRGGHARAITGAAISGDLLATKDPQSMRLWRSRGDHALLRVVTCRGDHVAFHPSGQFIVTGQRRRPEESASEVDAQDFPKARMLKPKVWGPAGGSAYSVGKPGLAPKPRAVGAQRPRGNAAVEL